MRKSYSAAVDPATSGDTFGGLPLFLSEMTFTTAVDFPFASNFGGLPLPRFLTSSAGASLPVILSLPGDRGDTLMSRRSKIKMVIPDTPTFFLRTDQ